jgi:hypothetical protein
MTAIPIDDLKHIKEILEEKMNESSDSEYTPSESESSDYSDKSKKYKKRTNIDYKSKYNKSESNYRYLQLELSNRNIEINEMKEKLLLLDNHQLIIKNINFVFERLDNAFKGLNEKINTIIDKNFINFEILVILDSIESMCNKTKDKYDMYINTNIYSLFPMNEYIIKNAVTMYYLDKQKEFDKILLKIKIQKYNTTLKNLLRIIGLIILFIIIIIIIIYYLIR